jgi:hypothetical protein
MTRRDEYLALSRFTRRFGAETDAGTYHIGEIDILDRLLAKGWPPAIYRGDECFGWLGKVATVREALSAVGLRGLTELSSSIDGLFRDEIRVPLVALQLSLFEQLSATGAGENAVDAKDRFYFEHRLVRYLHPSNEYKRSRVEVFNPLLDRDVLDVLGRVPWRWRLYKQIEERLMHRRFPRLMNLPLASRASIPDATRRWREDPVLRAYLVETLCREGPVWSRLFASDRLAAFVADVLEQRPAGATAGKAKRFAGRLLRSIGVYERYRRYSWRPLAQAQPSGIRLLQRLLTLRSWLAHHENRLALEI